MSRRSRTIEFIRTNALASVALFMALGGSAYAANTVFSSDIVDGEVRSVDVADSGLGGVDVAANSLTGADISESALDVAAMGCKSGKVLGFARVKGSESTPSFYTTSATYIDLVNNCAGGAPQVRRASEGVYFVWFPGNPAKLAVGVPNQDGATPPTAATQTTR